MTRLPTAIRRMTLVDGLRAVAALVVILPHAWVLFAAAAARPGPVASVVYFARVQGTLGVQVFFVLSGFVIAYSLRQARVTPGYFARFVARRSIRLDPPYWVGLAICCGVLWFEAHVAHDGAELPTPRQVLIHLAYLQQFLGCNDAINHTYWTLCIEVQLYLAYCGAIGLAQAAGVPYPPCLPVAFVAALAWPLGFAGVSVPGLFLEHAYSFLGGAAAWWTVAGVIPRWAALAAAGVAAALAARHGDVVVWVVAGTATLLVLAGRSGELHHWLDHRPVQALGRASYGLYLLHNPVISLALLAQLRLGFTALPASLAVLGAVGLVSVATAFALHATVERPCLRWARRLRGPTPDGTDGSLIPT